MFKKLKILLSLRAWLKSDTLKTGGVIGILGALQTFIKSDSGMGWVDLVAHILHLSSGTLSGLLLGVCGVAMLFHRAMTEWGLDEKVAGKDQAGFSTLAFMGLLLGVGLFAMLALSNVAHADEDKTFTYDPPTQYEDNTPLTASDLADYELGCGTVAGTRTTLTRTWAAGVSMRAENFPSGVWYCALRVTTTASATYPNQTSAWSNEVNFTVPSPPKAPGNLGVN